MFQTNQFRLKISSFSDLYASQIFVRELETQENDIFGVTVKVNETYRLVQQNWERRSSFGKFYSLLYGILQNE